MTINGLIDAKYRLINGILYTAFDVTNLNEIINWNEIKKLLRWVNVNFQSQADNDQTKHFFNNYKTKDLGEKLNFSLKLVDENNKNFDFEEG